MSYLLRGECGDDMSSSESECDTDEIPSRRALGDLILSIVSHLRQRVCNIAYLAQDKKTQLKCRPDDEGQKLPIPIDDAAANLLQLRLCIND